MQDHAAFGFRTSDCRGHPMLELTSEIRHLIFLDHLDCAGGRENILRLVVGRTLVP
jgi:hypothetical protein